MNKIFIITLILFLSLLTFAQDDENIFLSEEEAVEMTDSLSEDLDYSDDMEEEQLFEWKVDISASGIFSLLSVESGAPNLSTGPGNSASVDMGANLIFNQFLYASLSAKYLHLSFDVDRVESSSISISNSTTVDIKNTEDCHYISLPFSLGLRLPNKLFSPYIFGELEGSLLTASNLHSITKIQSTFGSGATLSKKESVDENVIDYRERHQIFLGAGLGFELNYGYGIVYLESSVKRALLVHEYDSGNHKNKTLGRGKTILRYIPITIGLRFFI